MTDHLYHLCSRCRAQFVCETEHDDHHPPLFCSTSCEATAELKDCAASPEVFRALSRQTADSSPVRLKRRLWALYHPEYGKLVKSGSVVGLAKAFGHGAVLR